jgi:hypothetical protein
VKKKRPRTIFLAPCLCGRTLGIHGAGPPYSTMECPAFRPACDEDRVAFVEWRRAQEARFGRGGS